MIDSSGFDEFAAQVGALRREIARFPELARGELEMAVLQGLLMMVGGMAQYPAPPAGSTYRRTGTLGRLWVGAVPRVTSQGRVVEGRVGNATPYGPYVQGEEQVQVHRGRWQTVTEVSAELEGEVAALLEAAGGRIVERMAEAV